MPRIVKINHIGLAVESLEQALGLYTAGLGLVDTGREYVPEDAVRAVFMPVGESRLELLEPAGESGPLQKFLTNRGQGMHHLCLEVEDLHGLLAQLREQGVELVDNEPRPGAHGTQVAFIHPRSANGVLIELVETLK